MSKGDSLGALLIALSVAGCGQTANTETTDTSAAERVEASAAEPELTAVSSDAIDLSRRRECRSDADCVPASCCHPTRCVPRHLRPNCAAVLCSSECRPGTLDCGQGYCDCQRGRCAAVIEGG
jgi:hypothetical protein